MNNTESLTSKGRWILSSTSVVLQHAFKDISYANIENHLRVAKDTLTTQFEISEEDCEVVIHHLKGLLNVVRRQKS